MGVTQVEQEEGAPGSTARTRPADLFAIIGWSPRMALRGGGFMGVAVIARLRGRRVRPYADICCHRPQCVNHPDRSGVFSMQPRGEVPAGGKRGLERVW